MKQNDNFSVSLFAKRALILLCFWVATGSFVQAQTQLTAFGTLVQMSKAYDGSDTARVIAPGLLGNLTPGDDVTMTVTAFYNDATPGEGKTIHITYSISGTDAGNYLPPVAYNLTGSITQAPIFTSPAVIESRKMYDATTICNLIDQGTISYGVVAGETLTQNASAQYLDANVGIAKMVVVSYTLTGTHPDYYVARPNDTMYADITPRQLSATGAEVKLVKQYDGNNSALVVTEGVVDLNFADGFTTTDDLTLHMTATYDDATNGHNKNITLHYVMINPNSNYMAPSDVVYSSHGTIVLPTVLGTMPTGYLLDYNPSGYCQNDNVVLQYKIDQGEPIRYRMTFNDYALSQGMTNTGWLDLSTDYPSFNLTFPTDALEGMYGVTIDFMNAADSVVSTGNISLLLHLNEKYLVQIFEDVISIDNRENRFYTYQWYHNGVAIDGATMPYYQEVGGLTGYYNVKVNEGTASESMSCAKSDFTTSGEKTVMVMPNPVVNKTTVKIHGFEEGEHVMRVVNAYGAVVFSTTFSGCTTDVDMTSLPQGTYMISVDGESAKAVKL